MTRPSPRLAALSAALVAVAALAGTPSAVAGSARPPHSGCSRAFERAVQDYRQTTFDKDADGFNALLDKEVTVVFADGSTLQGKRETAAFIDDFFADSAWTQTLEVARTTRAGCRAGFVLFDSVFTPSPDGAGIPLAIGVTFVHEHGRWLVLHNQDSRGPVAH